MKPVLSVLASLFLLGCLGEPDIYDLKGPRAQWRDHEPALYAYTVRYVCFCFAEPVHVVASRESVLVAQAASQGYDSLFPVGTLKDVASKQLFSIEALFDEVEKQLERKHDDHSITFDKTYGFPARVNIDFKRQWQDEEYGLAISDFRLVEALPDQGGGYEATLTLKPYLGLCRFSPPYNFGCPVISVDGGPFANSVSAIKGLQFEWGKEKTVLVNVKKTPAEWQEAPPYEYTLIRETGSVAVDSARFDVQVGPEDYIQSTSGPGDGGILKIIGYRDIAYTGAFPLDMIGDNPAKPVLLTLELRSGSLRLVSATVIP